MAVSRVHTCAEDIYPEIRLIYLAVTLTLT